MTIIAGPETTVNTTTAGLQSAIKTIKLAGGGWLVTWTSHVTNGPTQFVQQLYNADGNKTGSEIYVDSSIATWSYSQSIKALPGGGWIVLYATGTYGQGSSDTLVQKYSSSGDELGSAISVVNPNFSPDGNYDVAPLPGGGFMVLSQNEQAVHIQKFDGNGLLAAPEILIAQANPQASETIGNAVFCPTLDGGFAVAWTTRSTTMGVDWRGYPKEIDTSNAYVQVFNSDLTPKEEPFVLYSATDSIYDSYYSIVGSVYFSQISLKTDGNVSIEWFLAAEGGAENIHVNVGNYESTFDADGNYAGDQYIGDRRLYQMDHIHLSDGGKVAVFFGFGSDYHGIYQQIYNSDGSERGSLTQVSEPEDQNPTNPQVALLSNGGWVVVWENSIRPVSGNAYTRELYQKVYNVDGTVHTDQTLILSEIRTGYGVAPQVEAFGDGKWFVAWEADDNAGDVKQQVFELENTGPIAADDALTIDETASIVIDVLANDSDIDKDLLTIKSAEIVSGSGSVSITANHKLEFNDVGRGLYAGESRIVVISYKVDDGNGGVATGKLTLTINGITEDIVGDASDNILTGSIHAERIFGLDGNDTIDGKGGGDYLAGGKGDDTYTIYTAAGNQVDEKLNEGIDKVRADGNYALGDNVEWLILLDGGDFSGTGNALDNVIFGNSGNNTLYGGGGRGDELYGGNGDDTYIIDVPLRDNVSWDFRVVEYANGGHDTIKSAISLRSQLQYNVEDLILLDGAIQGSGNGLDNIVTGNAADNLLGGFTGSDTLIGGKGNDTYSIEDSRAKVVEAVSEGRDVVSTLVSYTLSANVEDISISRGSNTNLIEATGNGLDNILWGSFGDDVLDGKAGADTMYGGGGNNTYVVDNMRDIIDTGGVIGMDTVRASISYSLGTSLENLTLSGRANLTATGNSLANVLTGNAGNNILDGKAGNDAIAGGAGNDTYVVDSAGDVVTELADEGTDTVQTGLTHTLSANVENLTLSGGARINGTGNALANVLTGNGSHNILDGKGGADRMIGGLGSDTYIVGSTSDVVVELANEGMDIVQASVTHLLADNVERLFLTGTGNINAYGNALANILTGNASNNTIDGKAGGDIMTGGLGNDIYVVDNVGDVVKELANEGTDTVRSSLSYSLGAQVENLTLLGSSALDGTGNALANFLTGNAGNNILDGRAGGDMMAGGAGNDTYVLESASDIVSELANGGTDTVLASVGYALSEEVERLTLTGGSSVSGTGNALANTMTGNGGHNVLDGKGGADTMIGGLGNDTYVVDNAGDVVKESSNEGTDTVLASVRYTLSADVERLTLTGASRIDGTGNGLANILTGNSSHNILDGKGGADTMIGGLGSDTYIVDNAGDVVKESANEGTDTVQTSISYKLATDAERLVLTGTDAINGTGNSLANILAGNIGANTLDGKAGNDAMAGGAGDDTYVVDSAGDVVTELADEGTDTVQTGLTHTLSANVENLTLSGGARINGTGNALANVLTGNGSHNILDGKGGADRMIGGLGSDIYVVDKVGDVVKELANEGTDTVRSSISFALGAQVENLTLTGAGHSSAKGNSAANVITGNTGNNSLDGGLGRDILSGGAGKDIFLFNSILNATDNIDQITDFVAADDTIQLENSIFKALGLTGTLAAKAFAANTTGKAMDSQNRIIYETDTGKLFYDADGSGAGVASQFATLDTKPVITAADFLII